MTTKQSTVPAAVRAYIGSDYDREDHPIVHQTFRENGRGWQRYPIRKRVSRSWARKARAEGVTWVALSYRGRVIDFPIKALVR